MSSKSRSLLWMVAIGLLTLGISPGNPDMAQATVSSIWRDHLCYIWPHRSAHVLVPDLATLHPLPQTVGTKTHYKSSLHGPNLCLCFLPVISLLQARNLLRGHKRLLRGFCYRKLFRPSVPLHCSRSSQPKGLFSGTEAKALDLADYMVETMLRR